MQFLIYSYPKKQPSRMWNQLHASADGQYRFYDRLAQNKDTRNTYYMFCLFVYGLLAVITLITRYPYSKQYFHERIFKDQAIWSHACSGYGWFTNQEDD